MAKKIRYEKNAPLAVGDKVVCINMSDKTSRVPGGTPGIVRVVSEIFGLIVYYVDWINKSKLGLVDGKKCNECGTEQNKKNTKCEHCGSEKLDVIDQWRKVVEIDDSEDLSEGHLFYKTKKQIIKECKK